MHAPVAGFPLLPRAETTVDQRGGRRLRHADEFPQGANACRAWVAVAGHGSIVTRSMSGLHARRVISRHLQFRGDST